MAKTTKAPAAKKRPAQAALPTTPRVDLLPPIVEIRRQESKTIRRLSFGLVGLVAVVLIASVGASTLAMTAETALATENARKARLLTEEKAYSEVISVKALLGDYDAAIMSALYSEADWARIMREIDGSMPEGVAITSEVVRINGLGTEAVEVPAVSLDTAGVVSIAFTALSANVISSTEVLNLLSGLTGYSSAHVESVAGSAENGFTVTAVVELNAAALGGTPRTGGLNPEQVTALRDALHLAATQPPAPAPSTEDADDTAVEE